MAIETIRIGQWELELEVTQAFGGGYNATLGSIKYRMVGRGWGNTREEAIGAAKQDFQQQWYDTDPDVRTNF